MDGRLWLDEVVRRLHEAKTQAGRIVRPQGA
jgi:hypothetical protein